MKKTLMVMVAVALTTGLGAVILNAGEAKEEAASAVEIKKQTICPVMGGKIDKNTYVDHAGKRIYLCCAGCEGPVKADPEKYIKLLESQGITLDKAEVKENAEKDAADAAAGEKKKE